MNSLPLEIENIIYNYSTQLKFSKVLDELIEKYPSFNEYEEEIVINDNGYSSLNVYNQEGECVYVFEDYRFYPDSDNEDD